MHSFTIFFLISKVEQPPRVWFEKKKSNSAALALFQADSFKSFQMLATVTANIKVESYQLPSDRVQVTLSIKKKRKKTKTKNDAMVRCGERKNIMAE